MKKILLILLASITALSAGSVASPQNQPPNQSHALPKVGTVNPQKSNHGSSTLYENIAWVNWGGQNPRDVLCGAFSADCRLIATGEAHRALVWDAKSGDLLKILGLYTSPTNSLCFSPDGKLLATATGKVISLWDVHTLTLHSKWTERDVILELRFSRDANTLVSVTGSPSERYAVRLWNPATAKILKDFAQQDFNMYSADLSPDNRYLLLGTGGAVRSWDEHSNAILVWDLKADSAVQTHYCFAQDVHSVSFTDDAKYFACGTPYEVSRWRISDTTVRIWEFSTGKLVQAFADIESDANHVSFSADNRTIAISTAAGSAILRSTFPTDSLTPVKTKAQWRAPIFFSPDGHLLAVSSTTGKLQIWDRELKSTVQALDPKLPPGSVQSSVWAVAYSRDGKIVASGDNSNNLMLWRASDGKRLRAIKSGTVSDLSFSPDGKLLASSCWTSQLVKLWNTASGRLISEFRGHKGGIAGCSFSSDSHYLASCASDGDVRLWDVASRKCIKVYHNTKAGYTTNPGGVRSVAFGQHDSTIIAGYDGFVSIWDTWAGTIARALIDSGGYVRQSFYRVILSNSGKFFLSFGQNGSRNMCRVWNLTSGKVIWRFETGPYYTPGALSPDDRYIVTAGVDDITRIWDRSLGKQVFQFTDYKDLPCSLAWSPNGKYIFSGTTYGTLIMWKVPRFIN